MIQIDQHDDPDFGGDSPKGDEADGGRDRQVVTQQKHQPEPTHECKGHRRHDDQGVPEATERDIQQHEDDEQCGRYDDFQSSRGASEILELPRPGNRITRRQSDGPGDHLLHLAYRGTQVATSQIDVHPSRQARIFTA